MHPNRTLLTVAICLALAACGGPRATPTLTPPTGQPTLTNGAPTPTDTDPTPTDGAPTATNGAPTATNGSPTPTGGAPTPTGAEPTSTATVRPTLEPPALLPFADGLGQLTLLTHAGDGSGLLYAVDQGGVIRVVEADGTRRDQAFLDIRDRVRSGGERGLLGLAFHPDYATTGRFYVNYTDRNGNTVVAQFARAGGAGADPTADANSERPILTFEQPFANHNGGMVAFGPDGYLYISTGDGGSGGDPLGAGQDTTTLLGKILRIDVDGGEPYAIPPDNPFADGLGGARTEIWSYGLRNPWRFTFDRQTGDMFIGDVGQGTWEEVDAEPAGQSGRNYGWNVMEGPDCFSQQDCDTSGLTLPVAWYPTSGDGNCAVTGGYVYRGTALPGLVGIYVFADYCSGIVWGLDAATAIQMGRAEIFELARPGLNISAFGEDEQGELYVVAHDGQVLRISAR